MEACVNQIEVPNDDEVVSTLSKINGGRATALELCKELMRAGHPERQSQLAIQRAAERGRLHILRDWTLSIVSEVAEAA